MHDHASDHLDPDEPDIRQSGLWGPQQSGEASYKKYDLGFHGQSGDLLLSLDFLYQYKVANSLGNIAQHEYYEHGFHRQFILRTFVYIFYDKFNHVLTLINIKQINYITMPKDFGSSEI